MILELGWFYFPILEPTQFPKSNGSHPPHLMVPTFPTTLLLGLTYNNSFCLLTTSNHIYTFSLHLPPSVVYHTITINIQNKMMRNKSYFFEKTSFSIKNNSRRRSYRNRLVNNCMFMIPWKSEFSPIRFLKDIAERMTRAMCLGSVKKPLKRSPSSIGRSKSTVASADYYRTAAIEDCIEFMHTSFSRSNSSATATSKEEFMRTLSRNFES